MAWRSFTLVFLSSFLLCGSGTLVFGRLPAAARCHPTTAPDSFVGECRGIGDYEHAAYAFALEPRAVVALGAAKVVMLGNSRAQFAFSSDAARRFFPDEGVPAYRIGFGYDEGSPFALRVMGRAGARPRLAIVNADSFFTERLSCPRPGSGTSPGGSGWRLCAARSPSRYARRSALKSRGGSPVGASAAPFIACAATAPGLGATACFHPAARPRSIGRRVQS